MKKAFLCLALILAASLILIAVFAEGEAAPVELGDYFTTRDLSGEWDAKKAVEINLNEGTTISKEGVYILSGTITDGTVTVNAGKDAKVQLVLNNVSITSSSSAAILVESANKVFITLPEGTENTLASLALDENSDVDAAVFARDDLVLNGNGTLVVSSAGHGIVCKDDLKITGGTYQITATGRGISGNDSVRIADGSFTIVSENDAIRAKNEEDTEKGYILITGGIFDLTAGGGAENGKIHTDDMFGGGPSSGSSGNTTEETSDGKGLKASGSIMLAGGTIMVNAADDALHSDTKVLIYDGTALTASSGDDGIHSDDILTIEGGEILILKSYEGLEAVAVTVNGGSITLYASDDGINSSGGNDGSGNGFNDMFANDGSSIIINGGSIYVNSIGDGIDSNGDLTVNGGTVVVSGPTESMNGALDSNGSMTVNGGTVLAAGSTGMAETFDSASAQVSFKAILNGEADSEIIVSDKNGNVILSGHVEKSFACVVVSSPELQVGESYTVAAGDRSVSVTVSSVADDSFGGSAGGPGENMKQDENPDVQGPGAGNQDEGPSAGDQGEGPSAGAPGGDQGEGPSAGTPGGDQGEDPSAGSQGEGSSTGNTGWEQGEDAGRDNSGEEDIGSNP